MFGRGRLREWLGLSETPAVPASVGLHLAAADVEELAAIGREVAAEYGASSPAVLRANLTRLLARRVPVRGLRGGLVRSVGGLQFADGTVVLVRGRHVGDLGRIAVGIQLGEVQLAGFRNESDGITLEVRYGGHRDQLCALGVAAE